MNSSVVHENAQHQLEKMRLTTCKPTDFCVEVLTVTTATTTATDDDDDDALIRQADTADTEISFSSNNNNGDENENNNNNENKHRCNELNDIASYDEDECLIWCTESIMSASSSDQLLDNKAEYVDFFNLAAYPYRTSDIFLGRDNTEQPVH